MPHKYGHAVKSAELGTHVKMPRAHSAASDNEAHAGTSQSGPEKPVMHEHEHVAALKSCS